MHGRCPAADNVRAVNGSVNGSVHGSELLCELLCELLSELLCELPGEGLEEIVLCRCRVGGDRSLLQDGQ